MTDNELFGNSEQLNDTISRQAAIDAFKKELTVGESKGNYVTICSAIGYEGAKQILESLPSAQTGRKKGKWIYHTEIGWGDTWLCDQCGEKTTSTVMGKPRANYCPMCGAKMDGKNGETA